MKKLILPLFILSLFLVSGAPEPSRFATEQEMGKALLSALKKNDSLRYLQLYPTNQETNAAFLDPWKDSSIYDHQRAWVEKYYANNNKRPREMFRDARQKVINAGIDWSTVEFESCFLKNSPKRSPGIDYLFSGTVNCNSGERKIAIKVSDAMKTKDGWNCGLGLSVGTISPSQDQETYRRRTMDSMKMADSVAMVYQMMRVQWAMDSTHIADSLKAAEKAAHRKPK